MPHYVMEGELLASMCLLWIKLLHSTSEIIMIPILCLHKNKNQRVTKPGQPFACCTSFQRDTVLSEGPIGKHNCCILSHRKDV
jgi:hypothetical protein